MITTLLTMLDSEWQRLIMYFDRSHCFTRSKHNWMTHSNTDCKKPAYPIRINSTARMHIIHLRWWRGAPWCYGALGINLALAYGHSVRSTRGTNRDYQSLFHESCGRTGRMIIFYPSIPDLKVPTDLQLIECPKLYLPAWDCLSTKLKFELTPKG